MASVNDVDRIDFIITAGGVIVAKFRSSDGRYTPIEAAEVKPPDFDVDTAARWLTAHGFEVRRWPSAYGLPGGARAWKGAPRPIRTAAQIRRRRSEVEGAIRMWMHAHPGERPPVHVGGLDFALDM